MKLPRPIRTTVWLFKASVAMTAFAAFFVSYTLLDLLGQEGQR
jgi:hypothetical protein